MLHQGCPIEVFRVPSLLGNKPMGLFPRKYCNQTHIQSQLYHRQK
jgi:hypothetical protein